MKFKWSNNYSVGVKSFDEQHKHFFELSNKIYDLLDKKGVDKEKIIFSTTELANHAFYHLSSEEDAFIKHQYPETEAHIHVHNIYRQRIQEYLDKTSTKEFVDYVTSWLSNHILFMDKKYRSFFETIKSIYE
jgi:hemerythrin